MSQPECFNAAIKRLAAAARSSSPDILAEEVSMHGAALTRGELILRMCFHNGFHAGQLGDLRRTLEMPRIIAD